MLSESRAEATRDTRLVECVFRAPRPGMATGALSVVRFTGGASSALTEPESDVCRRALVARFWVDFAPRRLDWNETSDRSSSSAIDDAEADDVEARDAGSDVRRRVRGWGGGGGGIDRCDGFRG